MTIKGRQPPIVGYIKDIFITNTTSTYEDIPKDCKLVGAEFDQDHPTNSTRLNIIDDEYWRREMAENLSLPAFPSFDIETDKANAGPLWGKWVERGSLELQEALYL
jgi:hypothetical protein